eukprot:COSAG03_NODE_3787_length_1830_cov_2.860774_3_plen_76_part_00
MRVCARANCVCVCVKALTIEPVSAAAGAAAAAAAADAQPGEHIIMYPLRTTLTLPARISGVSLTGVLTESETTTL